MSGNAREFTDDNFQNEVLQSGKPVVVDLWADWCAPCRALAPTIDALAGELVDTITIGKLDITANPNTPAQFDVTAIPTILCFNGGKLVHRIVGGGKGPDDLKREFSEAFGVSV